MPRAERLAPIRELHQYDSREFDGEAALVQVCIQEYIDILPPAVAARNGWKKMLMACARTRSDDHRGMTRRRKPAVTVATFRSDSLFPRIERAVAAILKTSKVVTPIDVLVGMQLLTREHVRDWRHGRIDYLERVINCNLTRLSRLLRILRFHVHDLNLVPSTTVYLRHGKGRKFRLRFTKTGDTRLAVAYATHFVWPGKSPFHPPVHPEQCGRRDLIERADGDEAQARS